MLGVSGREECELDVGKTTDENREGGGRESRNKKLM